MPSWIASFRWKARIRCSLSRRSERGIYTTCTVCWLPAQEATGKATRSKTRCNDLKSQMNTACPCLAFRSVCNPVPRAGSELLLAGKVERETITCFADLVVFIFISDTCQPNEFIAVRKWLSKSYGKLRRKWEEKHMILWKNLFTA